ncbi:MAG: DNA repair protein RecO [Clostridiales bacterium]|nr:DNA repair protein RecO [Clostridiales bacterium]
MAYISTQALVLRSVNWRENDRIITLLTPDRGRVEALVRGSRKPKSALMAASQLFTLGNYVLFKGKGHELVVSCEVKDSYYPLRGDYDKLSYASIILSSAEMAVQLEEPQPHLMILLIRTLTRLAYTDLDDRAVTSAYLLHFISLIGYKPRLAHCVSCSKEIKDGREGWLDPQAGGLLCKNCKNTHTTSMKLEPDAVMWLRSVLIQGIEKSLSLPRVIPLLQIKKYVEYVLDRQLPQLPEYISRL